MKFRAGRMPSEMQHEGNLLMSLYMKLIPVALAVVGLSLATSADARRIGPAFKGAVSGAQATRAMPHFNHAVVKASPSAQEATRPLRMQQQFATAAQRMPTRKNFNRVSKVSVSKNVPPPNFGFAQGSGRLVTHKPGTVFMRRGGTHGKYMTTDLKASSAALSLPPSSANAPARFYRATAPITAPTGRVAAAYGQPGGATQVVLGRPVGESALKRTVVPNFSQAAIR